MRLTMIVEWCAIEALQLRKVAGEPPWSVDARYRVSMLIFPPDARRRDSDDIFKNVGSLNPSRWKDDSQIVEQTVKMMGIDKLNPRVEIMIEVIDG